MLLTSVVIVMREVLEAALVFSVLLGGTHFVGVRKNWAGWSLLAGLLGSGAYALNMRAITALFEGVGQEVVDAALQYCTFATLVAIVYLIVLRFRHPAPGSRPLWALMTVAVALALTREGAEILVYVTGFWQLDDFFSTVGLGSLLGAGIALSVGVLIYYLLLSQPASRALPLTVILLGLIGAGLCAQATGLLIQADWIAVAGPLWNTSAVLSENSLAGQLLYALLGYESSPSAKEVAIYAASLGATLLAASLARVTRSRQGAHR